jgi:phosphatidate cytidylyltransferase
MLFYANSPDVIVPVVGIIVFLACLFFMWRTSELSGVAQRIGLAVFAIMYLGFAFPMWGVIRLLPNGASLVLLALVPATLCDTFAFLAGKIFGRHKFAPSVSPNKTMEGFVGALLGSLMGTFVIKFLLLPELAAVHVVAISFIVWITSPFGDLIESMLKRSCGVKDSGTIIPGHGGVLDRLDALIFTGPAAYLYIRYVILPQLSPLI